eukprot:scaffold313597_cov22-Tisochrysis_lutea.AAC.1
MAVGAARACDAAGGHPKGRERRGSTAAALPEVGFALLYCCAHVLQWRTQLLIVALLCSATLPEAGRPLQSLTVRMSCMGCVL